MTREGNQPLPPEVEFQAKREKLSSLLVSLVNSSKAHPNNLSRKYSPTVYFAEGDEIFGLSFSQIQRGSDSFDRTLLIEPFPDSYSATREDPDYRPWGYDPPIYIEVLKENTEGNVEGVDGESIDTIERLDQAIDVANFILNNLGQAEETETHPIVDIPEALKGLAEKSRQNEELQYEKKGEVFFEVLARVAQKTHRVKVAWSRFRDRDARIVTATTGWVKVGEEGRRFELRLDGVERHWNGDWTGSCEVCERYLDGTGKRILFNSFDISRRSLSGKVTTAEKIQECIDILELLDRSLPAPVK